MLLVILRQDYRSLHAVVGCLGVILLGSLTVLLRTVFVSNIPVIYADYALAVLVRCKTMTLGRTYWSASARG